jgi:hypothetical protein
MNDLVISQVTLSTVVVVVMEWLKKAQWFPWISAQSDKVNKALGAFLAAVTAVGIHYTYDASTATLTFTGISFGALGHAFWHWLQSYAVQETVYKGAFHQTKGEPAKP